MEQGRFSELLEGFAGKRVGIVGDFILDEYLIGETKRVSREAPVVVIDYVESRYHPGGAANAAQNVCSLGGRAAALGVVGEDQHGVTLREVLDSRGVDVDGLVERADAATSVKTRILAGELHAQKQQMARIDRAGRVQEAGVRELSARLESLGGCDAWIISDYGMGVVPGPLSESLIEEARGRGVPVVIDSRFNLLSYRRATVATPNEVELFAAAADGRPRGVDEAAAHALSTLGMEGIIVTRGSYGMRVFSSASPVSIGIVGTSDVTDVTGAGDTVAAAVALSLAAGATLPEAAEMATYAAAVVVMKRGTATVDPSEMQRMRQEHPQPIAVPGEA